MLKYIIGHWPDETPFGELLPKGHAVITTQQDPRYKPHFTLNKVNFIWDQFPIIPALCITGHKSQGNTLDAAFVTNYHRKGASWIYVACSRVRRLQNLFLDKPLKAGKFSPRLKIEYQFARLERLEVQCKLRMGLLRNPTQALHSAEAKELTALQALKNKNSKQGKVLRAERRKQHFEAAKNMVCFRCGTKGHAAPDCPTSAASLFCSLCNKPGHNENVCGRGKRLATVQQCLK